MRLLRWFIVGLVLGWFLASCGWGKPWEGTGVVVGRDYDDPDTWEVRVDDPDTCFDMDWEHAGCQGITIDGGWHYETRHDGPHWHLTVEDAKGKRHTVSVEMYVYDDCAKGQGYDTATKECTAR